MRTVHKVAFFAAVYLLTVVTLATVPACAGKRAPVLVGQSALVVAGSIEKLQTAGKQLEQASVLPTAAALGFQEKLLALNTKMQPLPELLRTIDRIQQAGDSSQSETDQAIAILTVISEDLSVVVAGVPVSDAAKQLIELTRSAQRTVATVLVEVAKIRGRQ